MSLFLPFLPYFYPVFPPSGGSQIQDAAFGYFITACVVILLSILSYVLLPKLVSVSHTHTHTDITDIVNLRLLSRPIEICWSVKVILFWRVWCFLHLVSLRVFHVVPFFICLCFQEFFQFYQDKKTREKLDEENSVNLMNGGMHAVTLFVLECLVFKVSLEADWWSLFLRLSVLFCRK